MIADALFPYFSYGILPVWALFVLAPRWRLTQPIVHAAVVPALCVVHFVALLFASPPAGAGGYSREAAALLFAEPWTGLASWVHYLAYDLCIGAWQVRDADRRGVPRWLVVPCLLVTMWFGPTGLLFYLLARSALSRKAGSGAVAAR